MMSEAIRISIRIEDKKICNADEVSKYILEKPSEEWVKFHDAIMAGCNLQLMKKFIELFPLKSALSEMAAYSIVCRDGELLEELIVLGLDVNIPISEQDYGYKSINSGDGTLVIREIDYEGEDWLVSLLELALVTKRPNAVRILLRNGARIDNFWHYSGILNTKESCMPILSAISTNRRAARTLIGIKKFRGIYKDIDRFIFREIAISIWSSRDTI